MAKICHITCVHAWRDTRIFLKQCRSLKAMSHDVTLVALDQLEAVPTGEHDGINVIGVGRHGITGRLGRATKGAARVIRQAVLERPDIAFLHDPELIPWIPYLRVHGIKVVFDAHEDFVAQNASRDWAKGWKRLPVLVIAAALRSIVNLSANRILTATETIANAHPEKRTFVINNYPIEGELAPSVTGTNSTELPLSHRPARAIYVGGMNRIRGLKEIVEALDRCDAVEGLDLLGGFDSPAFKSELEALPGWQKVTFHGQCDRNEVAQRMEQARFGIVTFHPLPNHIHAKPNKLFEYMSAGLAVLHSDFPLWRTISEAPARGLAVDPEDVDDLARGMVELINHPRLDQMGQSAKDVIRTRFNWEAEATRLGQIVDTLIDGKR